MTALEETPIDNFDATAPDADLLIARLVRRLRSLEAKRDRARRVAEAEHTEITAWYGAQAAPIEHEAAGLRAVVEQYALAVLERSGGRTKSVSFPAGVVTTRTAEHWTWPEDPLDMANITSLLIQADHEELVRFRSPETDRVALKKAAQTKDGLAYIEGELLPGVTVETKTTVTVALTGEPETADDDNEGEETP